MEPSKLSNFLREKRLASGLSQKQVADELGYTSSQFISNWERGVSEPPVKVIKVLSKLYNTSPDALLDIFIDQAIHRIKIEYRDAGQS